MPRLISRSRAVFVVSEFTRQEVLDTFAIGADRVFVVPNSVDVTGVHIAERADKQDFLLVVGCHLPHKNIEEVLRVAHLWSDRYILRIVGATGYYGTAIRTLAQKLGLNEHIEFLPFVEDAELDRLYRQAAAVLYPSSIEGFGLPPLEALARGTLAIVSDIPVHREVMGDSACFVRLGDEANWAAAFATIDTRSGVISHSARQAVLDRYSPTAVGRRFDDALLTVAPGLRHLKR